MAKKELKEEMTLEEAKAYRASLYKPQVKVLSAQEKRDQFRMFWARSRKRYNKKNPTGLEQILWLHLQATGNDEPEKFEDGLKHFGLKKVS
jgi:hypothetical protein